MKLQRYSTETLRSINRNCQASRIIRSRCLIVFLITISGLSLTERSFDYVYIYICIGLVYTIFASYFNCSLYHRFWKRIIKLLMRQLFIIRNPISFIVHRSYIYHPSYWNSFFYGSFMRFLELIVVNEDNDRNGMFQFHLGELHVARGIEPLS